MPLNVPIIDQTAMGAQPLAAPSAAPMRNDAPQQIEQSGQALQQAGAVALKTGQTIGDAVAAQVDDAKVRAAETAALGTAQNVLNDPANGYLHQLGKSAVDQYEPAKQAVVKGFQDQLDGLDNSIQKQRFQQAMTEHLLGFGKQMADHNHAQSVAWSAGESKSQADTFQLMALNAAGSRYQTDADGNLVGDFQNYVFKMDSEVYKAAQLAGFEPDSAQAQAMIREQHTTLNQGIISKLLDDHDAAGAKKWFDEQNAAGNIDIRDVTRLGSAVKTEYDQQHVADVAQEILAASLSGGKTPTTLAMPVPGSSIQVTAGLGDPRAGGRTHDGIDIAVPVGTSVMAPAGGKVTKVWTDDKFGGGLSVEMQLPNGMTAGFAHLSAANVREGDEIQQGGQLGLSGESGNATGPVLHYMMKDADGNYVDPRQVSQPQPAKEGFSDPNALDTALKTLDSRTDLDSHEKKQVATMLESMHSHYRSIQNQKYDDNLQQATDALYASGGNYSAIPASMRLQLRPEDAYKLQQGLPKKDNVDVQEQFILNPDNQTVAWVQQHKLDFTDGTYLSYLNKVQNDANSPDKERNATLDNTQMDDILNKNGFSNLVTAKPGSDDAKAAVALKTRIMDQFVSEQNATKAPLTRDRKAQIIGQTVTDQVSVHRSILWDTTKQPVVGLTDSQAANAYVMVGTQKVKLAAIPAQDQLQITAALRRTGQPVTQQKIAEYWVKKNNGKVPTF